MPRDMNGQLIVSDAPNVNLSKSLLAMPCLAMHKVPADRQSQCISVVLPDRPEVFVRKYSRDSGGTYYLETELDYNPRNPQTFEDDASSYAWPNRYFQGFNTYESVDMPEHFIRRTNDGKIAVAHFHDTDEFRNAASWAVIDRSTRRTSAHMHLLLVIEGLICIKVFFSRGLQRHFIMTFRIFPERSLLHANLRGPLVYALHLIRPPDVSREGLKFYPETLFIYFTNPLHSAATQLMAINCIPEVRS